MVIRNITKFEKKEIKQSLLDENMWDFTKRFALLAVFFLLGLFILIFNINNSQDSLNYTLGIGFMAFAAVFISFFAFTSVCGYETRIPAENDISEISVVSSEDNNVEIPSVDAEQHVEQDNEEKQEESVNEEIPKGAEVVNTWEPELTVQNKDIVSENDDDKKDSI